MPREETNNNMASWSASSGRGQGDKGGEGTRKKKGGKKGEIKAQLKLNRTTA